MRGFHVVTAEFVENFFEIRNGLLRDFDEILECVVLMLLESGEEHLLDFVSVRSFLLRAVLLLILELDQISVVRNRFVRVHDPKRLDGFGMRQIQVQGGLARSFRSNVGKLESKSSRHNNFPSLHSLHSLLTYVLICCTDLFGFCEISICFFFICM